MSSISSIGSTAAQGLYSFIQSLAGANAASSTSSTASASTTGTTQAIPVSGGGHHHHHHGGGAMQQIQNAVTSALQNAQSSGSSNDPDTIIENAIAKVLQNNNSAATPGVAGTSDSDGDGSTGTSGTSGTGTSNIQSFNQLLQSFGVSPDQFREDFTAAIKDVQNGQVNPATALQSFPIGSTVDTIG